MENTGSTEAGMGAVGGMMDEQATLDPIMTKFFLYATKVRWYRKYDRIKSTRNLRSIAKLGVLLHVSFQLFHRVLLVAPCMANRLVVLLLLEYASLYHAERQKKCVQLFDCLQTRYYFVGHAKDSNLWRVLKFSRTDEPTQLEVAEDKAIYSRSECQNLLQEINDGNKQHGGLSLVCVVSCQQHP